jgi:hypothetical protein
MSKNKNILFNIYSQKLDKKVFFAIIFEYFCPLANFWILFVLLLFNENQSKHLN